MGANFQAILDSLAEKPPRSRLEPYRGLIEELVRRGRTYREIRQILAEKCGIQVALSTLYCFMAPQSPRAELKSPSVPAKSTESATPTRKGRSDGNTNQRHIDEVRQRIKALKHRKTTERKPEGFSYDPDQPLRLVRNREKGIAGE